MRWAENGKNLINGASAPKPTGLAPKDCTPGLPSERADRARFPPDVAWARSWCKAADNYAKKVKKETRRMNTNYSTLYSPCVSAPHVWVCGC